MEKRISILGASGSVGKQALDVAESSGYKLDIISADKNTTAIESAIRRHSPRLAFMSDESAARDLKIRVSDTDTKVFGGKNLDQFLRENLCSDTVVNAISGYHGLAPTLAVIDRGARLALANKESLVIAGDVVMRAAKEKNAEIIPVDSEHSAIFQSLHAGKREEIAKILLTASGGPFYGRSPEELQNVTKEQVLAHPTWKMGEKITVDSATLMNKGFEIIEACHLFGVPESKVDVLIHRESILHSAVEYIDRAVIAELSVPDMRECVQYAVDYPERHPSQISPLDLIKVGKLTFAAPDTKAFPLLSLAREAMADGGAMGAVLESADTEAVRAFLDGRISFADISKVVGELYEKMKIAKAYTSLEEIINAHNEARAKTKEIIEKMSKRH
jgi:1-deoxy-D-xylulose-5-phosphate reductoisomerase